MDDNPGEDDVTVGIGVLCEGGNCAVLASDTRVTYGPMRVEPHNWAGKQYEFAPFNLAAAIAGSTSSTHAVISEFAADLRRLLLVKQNNSEFQIVFEHIRNAIERARKRELRRLQGCEMESELGVSLQDWLIGKLPSGVTFNEYAHREGMRVLRHVRQEARGKIGIIVTGFLGGSAVFLRGLGFEPVEDSASPAIYVVGGKGAEESLKVLINRKQSIEMGVARTILHMHEALEAARVDRGVGEASSYVVMRPWTSPRPHGMLRFPPDHPTVKQWREKYALKSTEALESRFANDLVNEAMIPAIAPKKEWLGPKKMAESL